MIAELELEIIDAIKAAPLAAHLRAVDALPDLNDATALKGIATAAPAVYAVIGDYPLKDGVATVSFNLLCLARNARSVNAARRGDGSTIGLYQILDSLTALFSGLSTESTIWDAGVVRFMRNGAWQSAGLNAATLTISGKVMIQSIDESVLADFVIFHGDYDIDPHQPAAEHAKWLSEPSDHSTSAPELTDSITLQP
jgi:hypothetical protein